MVLNQGVFLTKAKVVVYFVLTRPEQAEEGTLSLKKQQFIVFFVLRDGAMSARNCTYEVELQIW